MKYKKFFLMILVSMLIMYAITYLNSFAWEHIYWSETRLYMNFMMGAAMAVIMLSFMKSMYQNPKINRAIYFLSAVLFGLSLWLVRSQVTIDDSSYMRAMIPHHSIAILTSSRSHISDVRVRKLADGIIKSQRREIKEMAWLIEDIQKNGSAKTEEEALKREVPGFDE